MANNTKSARIEASLEQMILDHQFKPGDSLPSQKELAQRFGVSPRSVREALNSLEVKGLVSIVQGKNTVVNETSLDRFIESLSSSMLTGQDMDRQLLMNLFQVIITIEVEAARGLSRDPERKKTLLRMHKVVADMRALLEDNPMAEEFGKEVQDYEKEFHQDIISAYDNQILMSIYDSLSPILYLHLRRLTYTRDELEKEINELEYVVEGFTSGTTDLVVALILVILNGTRTKCESLEM